MMYLYNFPKFSVNQQPNEPKLAKYVAVIVSYLTLLLLPGL